MDGLAHKSTSKALRHSWPAMENSHKRGQAQRACLRCKTGHGLLLL
jgi:hypothetical protein